jgi:hypothetical protein
MTTGIEAALGRPEFKIPCDKLLRAQGFIRLRVDA